jgi:stage V sporulation protein AD
MSKRIGKQTVRLSRGISILSAASTVGPKEAEGPLGKWFDQKIEDPFFGEKSWELAESKFVEKNMELAIQKANLKKQDIDYVL